MKRRLFWQLFTPYLAIVLISLVISTWYFTEELKNLYIKQSENALTDRAILVKNQIVSRFSSGNLAGINKFCKQLNKNVAMRITFILPSGKVVSDSEEDSELMNNHKNRPEILASLSGSNGSSIRYSSTLGKNMMYVAVPIKKQNKVVGIVRTSIPLLFVDNALNEIYRKIIFSGSIIALISTLISFFMARRISKPLEDLERGVARFTQGDLTYRLQVPNERETSRLAIAMNEMAAQLDNRITQIKKLEFIRKDFIANVSHELKTPITSIKGYAETLIDGALEDKNDAQKFTKIILNQADRLNNIIEDLLSLSRLDQESEYGQLFVEDTNIKDVLNSAIQLCTVKANSKNIQLDLYCDNKVHARINPSLLEQAVINLIDNAIKHSGENDRVLIEAIKNAAEVVIKVRDWGCGIPDEHLPRIFERFYRVDKARSRKSGGTGLGLAIVKHISQVHNGYTDVQSILGAGSIFSIHIPVSLP